MGGGLARAGVLRLHRGRPERRGVWTHSRDHVFTPLARRLSCRTARLMSRSRRRALSKLPLQLQAQLSTAMSLARSSAVSSPSATTCAPGVTGWSPYQWPLGARSRRPGGGRSTAGPGPSLRSCNRPSSPLAPRWQLEAGGFHSSLNTSGCSAPHLFAVSCSQRPPGLATVLQYHCDYKPVLTVPPVVGYRRRCRGDDSETSTSRASAPPNASPPCSERASEGVHVEYSTHLRKSTYARAPTARSDGAMFRGVRACDVSYGASTPSAAWTMSARRAEQSRSSPVSRARVCVRGCVGMHLRAQARGALCARVGVRVAL